jgi:hypothetical protein
MNGMDASPDSLEMPVALLRSIDDALLALAEVMKTLIRESFHLGGQVVNGIASTALHLTLEPGYLSRVRQRFTVHVVFCQAFVHHLAIVVIFVV